MLVKNRKSCAWVMRMSNGMAAMGDTTAALKEAKRGWPWVVKRAGKWQKDAWTTGELKRQSRVGVYGRENHQDSLLVSLFDNRDQDSL